MVTRQINVILLCCVAIPFCHLLSRSLCIVMLNSLLIIHFSFHLLVEWGLAFLLFHANGEHYLQKSIGLLFEHPWKHFHSMQSSGIFCITASIRLMSILVGEETQFHWFQPCLPKLLHSNIYQAYRTEKMKNEWEQSRENVTEKCCANCISSVNTIRPNFVLVSRIFASGHIVHHCHCQHPRKSNEH